MAKKTNLHKGELLYKYRSLKELHFLIDIIRNRKLYAAKFTELNDPMEGVYNTSERISEDMRKKVYKEKTQLRICALSKKKNSTLMWSHYADSHRGVVLGVKPIQEDDVDRVDVVYTSSLLTWGTDKCARSLAKEVFSKKLHHWIYEAEVRFLTTGEFIPIEIEEVLIGCRAQPVDIERIKYLFRPTIDNEKIRQLARHELDADSEM